jgi:phosphatidylglycerol:prolipoprotein diacylglycerol transferase
MHPIIGHIGGVTIYSHGLLIILAVVVATSLMNFLIGKSKLSKEYFLDNISTVVLIGVIGARIAYVILYYKELTSFWQAFYIWQGGLVSWGGFILGGLTFILLLRSQKQPVLKWLDIFGLSSMIGIGIGRIGCVLAGDIIGKASAAYPNGFPVAGFEAGAAFLLGLVLLIIYYKFPKLPQGIIFYESIAGYSLIRFILDGFRDGPTYFLGLNSGQVTAGIVLIATLLIFSLKYLIRIKNHSPKHLER